VSVDGGYCVVPKSVGSWISHVITQGKALATFVLSPQND
jgi:hypothetical protein